ncbi:MAG: SPOR domain-containing protein [Myxococcota bacterium]|jgi:cell division septation protein DedD|nr:SPOR domain-containing protein [Myxococcota bacterium]
MNPLLQRDGKPLVLHLVPRQVFFLLAGVAVSAGLLFLLGVLVGRGWQPVGPVPVDEADGGRVAAPVAGEPADAVPATASRVERVDAPGTAAPGGPAPAATPVATGAAASPPSATPTPGDVERLARLGARAEAAVQELRQMAGTEEAEPAVRALAAPAAPSPRVEPVTAAAPPSGAKPAAAAAPRPRPREASRPPASRRPSYTLQVSAFQERRDAEELVRTLRLAGYNPYLDVAPAASGGSWYRVRVGKFAERAAAEAFQRRFEKKQRLETFISRMGAPASTGARR